MNLNSFLLLLLGLVCFYLIKNKNTYKFKVLILFIIGYIITNNFIISLSLSLILVYFYMFINQDLNTEFFKNIKNRKNKKRKNKKRKNKKSINNSYLNNIEQIFDNKKTFEENYKSLTPDQIKGLNNDTQELINTQKNLIKTLKQMGLH